MSTTTPNGTQFQVATDINYTNKLVDYNGSYITSYTVESGILTKGVSLYSRVRHSSIETGYKDWSTDKMFSISNANRVILSTINTTTYIDQMDLSDDNDKMYIAGSITTLVGTVNKRVLYVSKIDITTNAVLWEKAYTNVIISSDNVSFYLDTDESMYIYCVNTNIANSFQVIKLDSDGTVVYSNSYSAQFIIDASEGTVSVAKNDPLSHKNIIKIGNTLTVMRPTGKNINNLNYGYLIYNINATNGAGYTSTGFLSEWYNNCLYTLKYNTDFYILRKETDGSYPTLQYTIAKLKLSVPGGIYRTSRQVDSPVSRKETINWLSNTQNPTYYPIYNFDMSVNKNMYILMSRYGTPAVTKLNRNVYLSDSAITWQKYLNISLSSVLTSGMIVVDNNENCYGCIRTDSTSLLFFKYDSNGNVEWQKRMISLSGITFNTVFDRTIDKVRNTVYFLIRTSAGTMMMGVPCDGNISGSLINNSDLLITDTNYVSSDNTISVSGSNDVGIDESPGDIIGSNGDDLDYLNSSLVGYKTTFSDSTVAHVINDTNIIPTAINSSTY